MTTKKQPKKAETFYCEKCNFVTSKKGNWNAHLSTRKHQMTTDDNKKKPKHICDICDKELADRVSLWKHKKTCKEVLKNELREPESEPVNQETPDVSKMVTPEIIMTLLTQNQELMMANKEFKELIVEQQQTMIDQQQENQKLQSQLIEAVKEGKTINNNCNNTNSNNKFNLNFFLNEQCKNAMNIADFVNNMVLTVDDLKKTGELGYVDGITKIFTDKLKAIDTYDRPMHCTDLKRETLYIKQNNGWDKDTDKEKMKIAIECVANKNLNNLGTWKEENPGHEVMDSREDQEYVKIMTNSLGGMGTDREKNKQKIIKNVLKEVMVEK
jgi:hypothetical protein